MLINNPIHIKLVGDDVSSLLQSPRRAALLVPCNLMRLPLDMQLLIR